MRVVQRIKENNFFRSIFILSSGILIKQCLSLITSPIVSRLFTPAEMGDIAVVVSWGGFYSALMTLGLMTAIMLPKEDEKARDICTLLLLVICFFSTLICVGMALVSKRIHFWSVWTITYPESCFYLWIYVITLLIESISFAYTNRQRMYRVMFIVPILNEIITIVGYLVSGYMEWRALGYGMSRIVGYISSIGYMALYVRPFHLLFGRLKGTLRENSRFLKYQWPANIIDVLSAQMPVQFFSLIFGNSMVGNYAMCMRVLSLPSALLAGSINRVYYKEAADRLNAGKSIGEFSYKFFFGGVGLAIIPLSILMLWGKPLFSFVFGTNWAEAGSMATILGMGVLMDFCTSCTSGSFTLIKKQNYNFFFSVFRIIVIGLLFFLLFVFKVGKMEALFVFTCAGVLLKIIIQGVFFFHTGVNMGKYLQHVIFYIILPSLICLCIVSWKSL